MQFASPFAVEPLFNILQPSSSSSTFVAVARRLQSGRRRRALRAEGARAEVFQEQVGGDPR